MGDHLPHEGLWARLGVSSIDGIGVFAIRTIPAGTNVFANDEAELTWIDAASLDASAPSPEQRRFYADFAVRRGDRLGCPANFNLLTIGWYLNEPAPGEEPNVAASDACEMVARRDIAPGEELTVRYATFSDAPKSEAALDRPPLRL